MVIFHSYVSLPEGQLGMSENGVYPQWNSHLVGVMISKTIVYNGVHDIFRQTQLLVTSVWQFKTHVLKIQLDIFGMMFKITFEDRS